MRFQYSKTRIILCLAAFLHTVLAFADPPVASSVSVTPLGPYVPSDVVTGSYTYSDADGHPEFGTLIQWYVNANPTPVGASLITSGSLTFNVTAGQRGQYIALAITPSDAVDGAGTRVYSSWQLVNALPQGTDDQYINQSSEGGVLTVFAPGVLANDNSGGDAQTMQAVPNTDPTHGILVLNLNGGFTYTHDGTENYTDDFTYRVYDGYEYSTPVNVHIQVIQVNDPPVFTSDSVTTAMQGSLYTYNITTSDPENNSRTITIYGVLPSWLSLTDYGNGTGLLSGTPGNDDVGTHSVTLRVSDGTAFTDQSFDIEVSNLNDAPILSNIEGTPLSYTEEEASKIITSTLQVSDPDLDSLVLATVAITTGLVQLEDRLQYTATPPLSSSYNPSTGILTISGKTTTTAYRTALRNVRYFNINTQNPSEANRIVSFTVNDGASPSNTVTRTIQVTGVNDPPQADPDNYFDVPEGGSLTTTLANGVLLNDDDADGPDALTAYLVDDVSYGYLTFNSNGTFTYQHDSSNFLSDLFTYYAYDGEDRSDTVDVNISMLPVNDPPVISNVSEDTLSYTEDDPPKIIVPSVQVTDEDNTSLQSATVSISQGYIMSEDSLVFSAVPGLTITFDTLTGVLTATGNASLSVYQNSLLRNIRYWNTNSEDPNTQYRHVTFIASDGEDASEPVTKVVEIVPWNDPPLAENADLIGTYYYVDELLTVDYDFSDPDGDPEGNTTFRWYTAEDDLGTGRAQILGWTTDTFTTRFSEGGKYVSAVVRPYDINGLVGVFDTTQWEYIDAAPELLNFTIRNFNTPGAFSPGQTVKADYTYLDLEDDPEGVHEYQWYRSNTGTWPTAQILNGEVADSFEIGASEEDKYIAVEAIPQALDGSSPGPVYQSPWFLVSAAPSAVMSVLPENDSLCNDGSTTIINVALSGDNPPWTFSYTNGTDTLVVPDIPGSQSLYELVVDTPGIYSLVSVSDSKVPVGIVTGEAIIGYYPDPTATMTRDELTICSNDVGAYEIPVTLTGKAPWWFSYQFSENPDSTAILNIDTAYVGIQVELADTGLYQALHVMDAHCMATATGSTDVLLKESPMATLTGDTTICPGDIATLSVELKGVGPWIFSYTLNEGEGVDVVVNQPTSEFTYEMPVSDPGIYALIGVVDQEDVGCASGTINVDTYETPTATIAGTEEACEGSSAEFEVVLTGEQPWSVRYQHGTDPAVQINNINSSPYLLMAEEAGNYTVLEVADAHCSGPGSGVATLVVNPLPDASILGMDTIYSAKTFEGVPIYVDPEGGNFQLSDNPGAILLNQDNDWIFYPFIAYGTVGSPFWIRYSYPDPVSGCVGTAEHKVYIIQEAAEINIDHEKEMYCFNDEPFTILGINIRNNVGTFSITGNQGLINTKENEAMIIPTEIEEGQKTITYTVEIDGEIHTAQKILNFNKINGDFTWDNECLTDDTEITFTDASSSTFGDFSWQWKFNFPGDTLTVDTSFATVRFSDLSRYTIDYIVTTSYNEDKCFDTVRKEFSLKPTFEISNNFTYNEGFTQDTAFWSSFPLTPESPNSWTWGKPTGYIWQEIPASERAWYTDIINKSQAEDSYIISPCFDFTNAQRPMIKMRMWKGFTQALDGAVLQYTMDNGLSWKNVGTSVEDGINWYIAGTIQGNPGGQPFGWTSALPDGDWVTARHKLDIEELKASKQVRFRIAYGSTGLATTPEPFGLAVDDIWIGERRRKVLVEHFTNSSDETSATVNTEINDLINSEGNKKDIIDIQYHLGEPDFGPDPFFDLNPEYSNSRKAYYSIQSVPYSILDGGRNGDRDFRIDYASESMEDNLLKKASLADSKFNISLQASPFPDHFELSVTLRANENIPQKELTMHVAVIESLITEVIGENGETSFESVFKTLLPNAFGTPINRSWNTNDEEYYSFIYDDYEDVYNDTMLRAVVFIQDVETKEVFQAEIINPFASGATGLEFQDGAESLFTLFPNPAEETAHIFFDELYFNQLSIELRDINGKLLMAEEIQPGTRDYELNVSELEQGIYFIKIFEQDQMLGTEKLLKLGNK